MYARVYLCVYVYVLGYQYEALYDSVDLDECLSWVRTLCFLGPGRGNESPRECLSASLRACLCVVCQVYGVYQCVYVCVCVCVCVCVHVSASADLRVC